MGVLDGIRNALGLGTGGQSFDGASRNRKLRGFSPTRNHINVQLQAAGPTLVARARWLYENDGYAGNAVDEWTSAVIGDGIKPRPRKLRSRTKRKKLLDLWFRWTEEADAEGRTDFYGLQEKVAREAYLAGECFARLRQRRPGDMDTVPFQIEILPTEMLDIAYDDDLGSGRYIRAGIEFNAIGRRVAYHFWRTNPMDYRPGGARHPQERVRVPAEDVVHVYDGRQAGQLRGNTRIARVLVKLFSLEVYDDAELDRKKNAALFAAFLTGRGDNPVVDLHEDEDDEEAPIGSLEPGAIIDLGDDKDVKFSTPAEVGGSYEPFQYRNLLKICAGLGVPYAIVTGDVTRGNFANVRTAIVQFRRRCSQWQNNTMIFQFCRPIWDRFVTVAVLAGDIDAAEYERDPSVYHSVEWLTPVMEWIDPEKDVNAEIKAIDHGLKSRTAAVAQRGYDREDLDDEIEEERKDAAKRGLKFSGSDKPKTPGAGGPGGSDSESATTGLDGGNSPQDDSEEDDEAAGDGEDEGAKNDD